MIKMFYIYTCLFVHAFVGFSRKSTDNWIVSLIIRGLIICADLKERIFSGFQAAKILTHWLSLRAIILMWNIRKWNIWKIVGNTVNVFIILYRMNRFFDLSSIDVTLRSRSITFLLSQFIWWLSFQQWSAISFLSVSPFFTALMCSLDLTLKDLFDSPMYVASQSLHGILYTMLFCRSET